ncbi:hypothetical protein PTTG_28211 [Puccinia triticina 1-1 BBBD Race 1]|uniref:GCM domain-containing protein n=1 Tax=Puccinia triticina (isolate 1-1 / race 1 (BBBD)) TaxID=630390 RepID=A0A180GEP8_PUCT1|nr:hypothetical protein PTTG_28211 [Puccinia triticina 1-1 BBBD Race 1]
MLDSGSNHKDLSQPYSPPKDPENKPINGRKTFFAPSGNEQTFIDHDCTLDDEGYPLYPNRQTIFVKTPEMTVHNFGHVGFPKTTSVDWRANRSWKGVRMYCLGALICNQPGCQWVGSPPTAKGVIEEYLEMDPRCPGSAGKCPGKVGHQACKNTLIQFDKNKLNGWAILCHHGTHNHPWAAPKKPDPLLKLKLKNEIKKNPSAGAFKLKLGKPTAPLNPFKSVTKIHEAFVNSNQLHYHWRLILTELGINPDKGGAGVGNKFLHNMFHWKHVGLLIISASFRPGVEHLTFQTKWMAERLVTRDHNNKEEFQKLCLDLLVLPKAGKPTHDQKIDKLRRLFPKTRRWLDWWTMVDVKAILFPSKQTMISDSGNGKDNLPDTTNAQESMHCLYYMISEGKKCLIIGMAQLYAFVKTLEDNWHAVMRGVSIEYGAKNKGQQDLAPPGKISGQMGAGDKPPKRNPANCKKAELNDGQAPNTTAALLPKNSGGRPPGLRNLIKDSMTTYISYLASDAPARNLYALFNPLWLCGKNGLKSNIFTTLVKHYNARSTWELTLTGQIRSMLTTGQNSLHSTANKLSPGSFNTGVFCSTNLFIDLLIDPFLRKNPKNIEKPHPCGIRDVTVLRIQKEMFEAANMEPCLVQGQPNLTISFKNKQQTFMAGLDFPRYLEFHGVKYTLFACSFWNGSHYWCKMLKNLGGILGVWMHDNRQNGGIARLISPDQSTISGRAPNTSWVFYSRLWSSSEDKFVSKSIANIACDHLGAPGLLPFAHLGMLLKNLPSQLIPTLNEDHSTVEDQQIAALSDKQGPKLILLDGKEVAAAPKKNRRPKKVNLPLNEDNLPIEDQHIAAVSDKQAPKILLDAKEVATAQKKKWRPKKITRLQEAGSSPSGAAQATIGAPSGEENPGDLKRKASGEFRIQLKVLKTNNPQPMITDSNIEEKKCPIKGKQASTTIKPTIEEQKTSGKFKIPSDQQQKPIRVGSQSSTRKALQALQA